MMIAIGTIIVAASVAGAVLMAMSRPSAPDSNAMNPANLDSFNITQAKEGLAVPLIYGTVRIPGNIIWYGNLTTEEITQTAQGGKSSGGGGSQTAVVGYKYYIDVWQAICQGPIVKPFVKMYVQGKETDLTDIAYTTSFTINDGYIDTYFPTEPGSKATRLRGDDRGIAHVFLKRWYIGNNTSTVPTVHFVVQSDLTSISPVNSPMLSNGANPAAIIYDILVESGVSTSKINLASFNSAATYYANQGYGLNISFNRQTKVRDMIQRVLSFVDGILVIKTDTDNKAKFFLKHFDPLEGSVKSLVKEDYIDFTFSRPSWTEVYNDFKGTYTDASMDYSTRSLVVTNTAIEQLVGYKKTLAVNLSAFNDVDTASKRIWELMKRLSYPVANVTFKTNLSFMSIDRGDVVQISNGDYTISSAYFRVYSVNYSNIDKNEIAFELKQVPERLFDTSYQLAGTADWTNTVPSYVDAIVYQRIFEMPYNKFTQRSQTYLLLASRQIGNELGFYVIQSSGGTDYSTVFNATTWSQRGTLDEAYVGSYNVDDDIGILYTPTIMEDPIFDSISRVDLFVSRRVAIIDDEIISFQTVTPEGPGNSIRLTGCVRGLLNTPVITHTIGTEIWITDISETNLLTVAIGTISFFVKYLPYNAFTILDESSAMAMNPTYEYKAVTPWTPSRLEVTTVNEPEPPPAPGTIDDFTGANGSQPDNNKWLAEPSFPPNATFDIQNNQLHYDSINQDYVLIIDLIDNTNFNFNGSFDIQVDFNILNYTVPQPDPIMNYARHQIAFTVGQPWGSEFRQTGIEYYVDDTGLWSYRVLSFNMAIFDSKFDRVDGSGKLRITRDNDGIVALYYWNNDFNKWGWYDNANFTESGYIINATMYDAKIQLSYWNGGDAEQFEISFDNVISNSATQKQIEGNALIEWWPTEQEIENTSAGTTSPDNQNDVHPFDYTGTFDVQVTDIESSPVNIDGTTRYLDLTAGQHTVQVRQLINNRYSDWLSQVITYVPETGPLPSTSNMGVFGGGYNNGYQNVIDYIDMTSGANASDFGDLSLTKDKLAACSNGVRGIFAGGTYDVIVDQIEYINLATLSNSINFGNLTQARHSLASTSSIAGRGLFAGGYDTSSINVIDYIEIDTEADAIDFGDLFETRYFLAATTNGERAIFGGGNNGTYSNTMDYVEMDTLGNATDFGNLFEARQELAGSSNGPRGIFAGGTTGTVSNTIDYITIDTLNDAIDFGNLTIARTGLAGLSSDVYNYFGGGNDGSASNVIDYIEVATLGDAIDFSDLTIARGNLAGTSGFIPPTPIPTTYENMGVFAGSTTSATYGMDLIQRINITTNLIAIDFGDLTTGRMAAAGCSSLTRGVFAGGLTDGSLPPVWASATNVIDYIEFATGGIASNFNSLITPSRGGISGTSNGTWGVFAGGKNGPTRYTDVERVLIASEASIEDFGDIGTARQNAGVTSDSNGKAVIGGGYADSGNLSLIESFQIGGAWNVDSLFGNLTVARNGLAACTNGSRAVFAGGYSGGEEVTIDYFNITTYAGSFDFGDLITQRTKTSSVSNGTDGIFAGGAIGNGPMNSREKITIDTTSNAIDFGDLLEATAFLAGVSGYVS